jgi:hypothetical protein
MRAFVAFVLMITTMAAATSVESHARMRSNVGATPQAAALNMLRPGDGFQLLGARIAGRFAIVRFTGALMEGNRHWSDGLVIERFPFGWQVLGIVREACLGARGANPSQRAALGASRLPAYRTADGFPCETEVDRGSFADISAVRSAYRGPSAVSGVHVVGDYALLHWVYPGGGEAAFARHGGAWQLLTSGGGAMNAAELHGSGVPVREACVLRPPDQFAPPDVHAMCRSVARTGG